MRISDWSSDVCSSDLTIRLPANDVLQRRIGHLQTRLIGPPPKEPIISFASFRYQAKGWTRSRRAVARFEWQQGELYPRVGFIVTNLRRPPRQIGRAHVGTPVTNAHLVCRLLLENKNMKQ